MQALEASALLEDKYTEQTFHVSLGSRDKLIMLFCEDTFHFNHRSRDHSLYSAMGMTHFPLPSITKYTGKQNAYQRKGKIGIMLLGIFYVILLKA